MKKFYILAGANGSGKSTMAKVLLPSEGVVFVNPDEIAKELNSANPVKVQVEAGKTTLRRVAALIENGESFAVESTLSGRAYVKMIEKAKSSGYQVVIAYIFVDSPEVCIKRIATRVQAGGHFVPAADVVRRYSRSKKNFLSLYSKIVNRWLLYYNGGMDLSLVAHGTDKATIIVAQERYNAFKEEL